MKYMHLYTFLVIMNSLVIDASQTVGNKRNFAECVDSHETEADQAPLIKRMKMIQENPELRLKKRKELDNYILQARTALLTHGISNTTLETNSTSQTNSHYQQIVDNDIDPHAQTLVNRPDFLQHLEDLGKFDEQYSKTTDTNKQQSLIANFAPNFNKILQYIADNKK